MQFGLALIYVIGFVILTVIILSALLVLNVVAVITDFFSVGNNTAVSVVKSNIGTITLTSTLRLPIRACQDLYSSNKCKYLSLQRLTVTLQTLADRLQNYQRLTSILLSHFMLDLRSIYLKGSDPTHASDHVTTLAFVSNVEGNLGASLDASWATSQRTDSDTEEDEDEIQYSDNPLATGLLDLENKKQTIQD